MWLLKLPVATNVVSDEILLDTAAAASILINLGRIRSISFEFQFFEFHNSNPNVEFGRIRLSVQSRLNSTNLYEIPVVGIDHNNH